MSLKQDLAKAIAKAKISNNAAAKRIGVTYPSLKAVLDGVSFPNARSIGKYAAFLGIDEDKLKQSVEKEKDASGRRPGRPMKSGNKKAAGASKKTTAKETVGASKKTVGASKKTVGANKTTAATGKKTVGASKKTADTAPKVDQRALLSLEASLRSLDQLRDKIANALKKLQ